VTTDRAIEIFFVASQWFNAGVAAVALYSAYLALRGWRNALKTERECLEHTARVLEYCRQSHDREEQLRVMMHDLDENWRKRYDEKKERVN